MDKVLLIDDDAIVRRQVSGILSSIGGFSVDTAMNGLSGLEMYNKAVNESKPYDVVIVDLLMPVLSGEQVMDDIRRKDKTTPIIILTANADLNMGGLRNAKSLLYKYHVSAHICKPIENPDAFSYDVYNAAWMGKKLKENERHTDALAQAKLSKQAFLTAFNDQFRQPLNAVMGFTQLVARDLSLEISDKDRKSVCKQRLGDVMKSANQMLVMIQDLERIAQSAGGNDEYIDNDSVNVALKEHFVKKVKQSV